MGRINFRSYEDQALSSGRKIVAGVDEVGRGPLAGPLVLGVLIYDENIKKIQGLNDSKLVCLSKRESMFCRLSSFQYGLGTVWPCEIDKYGLSKCLQLGVERALRSIWLHYGLKPDYLFVDGRIKLSLDCEYENLIKGDQKVRSIAGASILAKVFRDNLMRNYDKVFSGFDWRKHKGYGTSYHRSCIMNRGMRRIHRKSFLTNFLSESQ